VGFTAADRFNGGDDKLSAYLTFQQPIADWTLMPGIRLERDSRRISSPGHPDVRFSRTNLFPTLHVDHQLGRNLDLTLSYSKRIDRPPLNELRPYEIVQDVLTVKRGNPHLKDQSTDAYEINLHYHRKSLDAGLIVYDRETSDLFSSAYSAVNGVNVSMLVNAGHSVNRGAEIDVSTPLVKRVKLNSSMNLFQQRMPLIGARSDVRFRYTLDTTIQWTGPDRGKRPGDVAQLQWVYSSPQRSFEIHNFAWNLLSLSYTHSLSRDLSLTATANYVSSNRHLLEAPLVQEYFAEHRRPEFKIRLLKTFGNSK
jgi:ferric enterobactin receptor